MKRKVMAAMLAASLMGSLLAGCGSSSSGTASSTADTTAASSDSSAASTSADSSSAADLIAALPDSMADGKITATPEMYPGVDMSDPYTVNMYLIGDTPNDWDDVLAQVNDYLKPFNTDLNVTFMSWSDYQTNYSLVLAGGEQIDCIFTAPWCYMQTEALKGSFYTLDEDFRNTNMPLSQKYQNPDSWKETTIGGNTIAIPSNTMQPNGKIVAIRQDLADKYGISSLGSWDDYKNFLETIAEKETPTSGILGIAASGDNSELWDVYRQQDNTFYALESDMIKLIYSYQDGKLPASSDIKLAWDTDLFRSYAKDAKELLDKGAWSRSALNETVTDDDAFGNLQGASIAWNTSVFTYIKQAEQTDGVKCAAYLLTPDKLVAGEAYSNNDMAITASSSNPQRTAMVLDLLKNDTTLNHLILYGIEGTHYTDNGDGTYTELQPKAGDYAALNVSLSWAIKNGDLEESGADPRQTAIVDQEKKIMTACPTISFVFDTTPVQAQMDAVNTVLNDYVKPLQLGLMDDPDASIDEMMQKANDAGLQDILTEFASQYDAWAAEQ